MIQYLNATNNNTYSMFSGPMKEGQCMLVAALALGLIYLLFRYFAVPQAVPVVSVSPLRVLREEYTIWPVFMSKLPHIPVLIDLLTNYW